MTLPLHPSPPSVPRPAVFLGTIALEPHRWGTRPATRFEALKPFLRAYPVVPAQRAVAWLDRAAADGFDGIELFEPHAVFASEEDLERIAAHPLPVAVFNTYLRLDDPDATWRDGIAALVSRLGARGVKFNVGRDPERLDAEVEALRRFADALPDGTRLLCECHGGSHAETPEGAARLRDRWTDPRLQFVVHLAEPLARLDAWVHALGSAITRAHVWARSPELPPNGLAERARHLRALGFHGSFTVEFTRSVRWGEPDPAAETLYGEAVEDLRAIRACDLMRRERIESGKQESGKGPTLIHS